MPPPLEELFTDGTERTIAEEVLKVAKLKIGESDPSGGGWEKDVIPTGIARNVAESFKAHGSPLAKRFWHRAVVQPYLKEHSILDKLIEAGYLRNGGWYTPGCGTDDQQVYLLRQ